MSFSSQCETTWTKHLSPLPPSSSVVSVSDPYSTTELFVCDLSAEPSSKRAARVCHIVLHEGSGRTECLVNLWLPLWFALLCGPGHSHASSSHTGPSQTRVMADMTFSVSFTWLNYFHFLSIWTQSFHVSHKLFWQHHNIIPTPLRGKQ